MSLKSPANNFGSGNGNFRAIVTAAAAALIGTVVGGVSVLGVVVAVTQPPNQDVRSDAQAGGGAAAPTPAPPAPPAVQAAPPQPAPLAERQSAPAVEGPRTVWPDALSARSNHGPETESPASPQASSPVSPRASPPRNDRQAESRDSVSDQNEENGTRQSAVGKAAAAPRDSLPNPISPNSAPAKRRVVTSPPPPAPSTERTVDEAPADMVPVGKARGDTRKSQSQLARQKRAPDDQSDQAAYPPQRRVIVLPGPDQAASDDRGHWGGGGLFDFFGGHRYNDRWNDDHDWHGSGDWRD
jgi:hypothetical protein